MSIDINADLDLPLKKGKEIAVDNQLIAFRDVSPNHPQYQRVKQRLADGATIRYDLNINALRNLAKFSGTFKSSGNKELSNCALLGLDLFDAFSRIDSIQRLRTTMTFLYFTLDRMAQITRDRKLWKAATFVFNNYISAVYLDDLNFRLDYLNFYSTFSSSLFFVKATENTSFEPSLEQALARKHNGS